QPPDQLPPDPPAQPTVENVRQEEQVLAAEPAQAGTPNETPAAAAEAPATPVAEAAAAQAASAEAATPAARPAPATSPVPGRVPAPAVEAEPMVMPMRHSVGVELELARLTPVEIEQPKALYRSLLPGIM